MVIMSGWSVGCEFKPNKSHFDSKFYCFLIDWIRWLQNRKNSNVFKMVALFWQHVQLSQVHTGTQCLITGVSTEIVQINDMISLTIGDSASYENLFSSHKIENILCKRELLMCRRLSKKCCYMPIIGMRITKIRSAPSNVWNLLAPSVIGFIRNYPFMKCIGQLCYITSFCGHSPRYH